MVFSIHGEIFTAPVEEGDLRQITDGPARDSDPQYSPDGKWIAFISATAAGAKRFTSPPSDGAGEAQKITDIDALKFGFCVVAQLERDCIHRFRQQAAQV